MISSAQSRPGALKPHYYQLLAELHAYLRPDAYMEIGVFHGESISLASNSKYVIGVDPAPSIQTDIGKAQIFTLTSDDFFATIDVRQTFGGGCIDFAFIDGLHLFEQTLRDFFNVQKYCDRNSLIAVHDCHAHDEITAGRERTTDFWTGDVWRIIPALKRIQPALLIRTIDVDPTGLCLISNLDPGFALDERAFEETVDMYMRMPLPATPEGRAQVCNIVPYHWTELARSVPRRP